MSVKESMYSNLGLVCLMVASMMGGCRARPPGGSGPASDSADLSDQFNAPGAASRGAATGTFDRRYPVIRKGVRRDAMILIAPVTARAPIRRAAGGYLLEALGTQVFNTGDGIQLDVYQLEHDKRTKIYSRYFDAGRCAADRDWVAIRIPLYLAEVQDSWIEFDASAGPQGDLVGDWLALSSVRLLPEKEAR